MTEDAATRIVLIVEEQLDLDPGEVTLETAMDNCENWDSLAHLRVCMAVESSFGTKFTMDQISEVSSIRGLTELVTND